MKTRNFIKKYIILSPVCLNITVLLNFFLITTSKLLCTTGKLTMRKARCNTALLYTHVTLTNHLCVLC